MNLPINPLSKALGSKITNSSSKMLFTAVSSWLNSIGIQPKLLIIKLRMRRTLVKRLLPPKVHFKIEKPKKYYFLFTKITGYTGIYILHLKYFAIEDRIEIYSNIALSSWCTCRVILMKNELFLISGVLSFQYQKYINF